MDWKPLSALESEETFPGLYRREASQMELESIAGDMASNPSNGFNYFIGPGMIFLKKTQAEEIIAGNYPQFLRKEKFESAIKPCECFLIGNQVWAGDFVFGFRIHFHDLRF